MDLQLLKQNMNLHYMERIRNKLTFCAVLDITSHEVSSRAELTAQLFLLCSTLCRSESTWCVGLGRLRKDADLSQDQLSKAETEHEPAKMCAREGVKLLNISDDLNMTSLQGL